MTISLHQIHNDLFSTATDKGAQMIRWKQSGSGAVDRTIDDKLKDGDVSVKDFGAIGDGVTDDTAAINNALVFTRRGKKTLYFPQGTYLISSPILLNSRYDSIIGSNPFRVIIQPIVPGMTCFVLSVQNVNIKNIGFSCPANSPAYLNFTALELRSSHNNNIDNIYCIHANKFIHVTESCYENFLTNMFVWKVHAGLYCDDGITFNNNHINFSLGYGSAQTGTDYELTSDIGIRICGSGNKIYGGEWSYWNIAWEICSGTNNQLDGIWAETNLYDLKNTSKKPNIMIGGYCERVYPDGAELICTENGYGSPGVSKNIGFHGYNIYDNLKYYLIFNKTVDGKNFYDYSVNNITTTDHNIISVNDYANSFGTVKSIAIAPDGYYGLDNLRIDTSKPLTICMNVNPKNADADTLYGFRLTDGTNRLAMMLYNHDNFYNLYSKISGIYNYDIGNCVCYGDNSKGYLAMITIDFPNDKLYLFTQYVNSNPTEVDFDLAVFRNAGTLSLELFKADDSNPHTVNVIVNYLMIWDKALNWYDFFNILKLKNHVAPLNYIRKSLSAAPTAGTWRKDDIVYNSNPSVSGYVGWVCTAAGTPGAWQPFGSVGGNYADKVIALPAPDSSQRGRIVRIEGGVGVTDIIYVCKKLANDTYDWVQIG